jgi:hypothetical protein
MDLREQVIATIIDVLEDTPYALDPEDMRSAAEAVIDRLIADGALGQEYGDAATS